MSENLTPVKGSALPLYEGNPDNINAIGYRTDVTPKVMVRFKPMKLNHTIEFKFWGANLPTSGMVAYDLFYKTTGLIYQYDATDGWVLYSDDYVTEGVPAGNYIYKYGPYRYIWTVDNMLLIADSTQEIFGYALSDQTSNITAEVKITETIGRSFALCYLCLSLTEAATGGTFTVNIKKNGTTIFTTKITIDATETSSITASVPYVLTTSPTLFNTGNILSISVDAVGGTATGKGAIIRGYGYLI